MNEATMATLQWLAQLEKYNQEYFAKHAIEPFKVYDRNGKNVGTSPVVVFPGLDTLITTDKNESDIDESKQ